MPEQTKRPGPIPRWKNPTTAHVRLERGELVLLQMAAQRDRRSVSELLRDRIVPLLDDCRKRFPQRAADLERRGLM